MILLKNKLFLVIIQFLILTLMIYVLIPIIIFFDFKKAYSTNLSTFFLFNFFFYVFLFQHENDFFESHFPIFIINTLLLGSAIIVFSIGLSIVLKYFKKLKEKQKQIQFDTNEGKFLMVCPKCGTEFLKGFTSTIRPMVSSKSF